MSTEKIDTIKTPPTNGADKKRTNVFGNCANMFVKLYHHACNVFFPSHIKCIVCGEDLKQKQDIEVCDKCQCKLHKITESECCARCGAVVPGQGKYCLNCQNTDREFDIARSVFVYENEVKRLIAGLKYNNKPYLSRTLSNYLAELYKSLDWQVDLIIPVPLSKKRKEWRGYNQAELLADGLSDAVGVPLNTETLVKIKDTDSQTHLSMVERRNNLRESFKVMDKYAVRGKKILLVDDVMTTGATANACANVLKKAHADRVLVLTIAHGLQEIPAENRVNDSKNGNN